MAHEEIDSYVPFAIDRRAASRAAHTLCGAWWKHSSAAGAALRPEALRAVYVPFWRVYGRAECTYTGAWGEEQDYEDSNGDWQTDTDWYSVSGETSCEMDDAMLLCASEMYADDIRKLFPYDLSSAKDGTPEAAEEAVAAECTRTWETAWDSAQEDMHRMLRAMVRDEMRRAYDTELADIQTMSVYYTDIVSELILLPVWETSFTHAGRGYTIRINGQTGTVSGDVPTSWLRVGLITAAVLLLLGYLWS